MSFMYEFPHSSNFDSDLAQIVDMYLKLKNLPDEYEKFTEYVNDYFNNLDVSTEISNKLDQMYENGQLAELVAQSNYFDTFGNKSIVIIGDSMSDNTTFPPNWTIEFTAEVEKVGATVTNMGANGASFAGWANNHPENPLDLVPKADIYIVFLGINDFQGQFPWTGGVPAFSTPECVRTVFNRLITLNKDAKYYYISPIKILREPVKNLAKPLICYRALYEGIAAKMGFTVISGYNAPQLSSYNPDKIPDTLHPSSEYGKVLARYFINAMVAGVSTFTPFSRFYSAGLFTPTSGEGYTNITLDSDFNAEIRFNTLSSQLQIGWNTVCALNDVFKTNAILQQTTVFNPSNAKTYQVRMGTNGIEIYSTAQESANLDFVVSWHNLWNYNYINL